MNDLDLYNACMDFCRVYVSVITHKSQLDRARLCFDEVQMEELSHRVRLEEHCLKNNYNHLCEVIEELERRKTNES